MSGSSGRSPSLPTPQGIVRDLLLGAALTILATREARGSTKSARSQADTAAILRDATHHRAEQAKQEAAARAAVQESVRAANEALNARDRARDAEARAVEADSIFRTPEIDGVPPRFTDTPEWPSELANLAHTMRRLVWIKGRGVPA